MVTVHLLQGFEQHPVLWLLEALGLEYDVVLHEQLPRSPSLRAVHPLGEDLVVVDQREVICGAGVAMELLAQRYDGEHQVSVTPTDARYAEYLFWLHYGGGRALRAMSYEPGEVQRHLDFCEARLGEDAWLFGAGPTAADMQLGALLSEAKRLGFLVRSPRASSFLERCAAQPAWERAAQRLAAQAPSLQARAMGYQLKADETSLDPQLAQVLAEFGFDALAEQAPQSRSDKSKRKLATALLSLIEEGVLSPTVDQLAERAGVSRRLVFHHFESMDYIYAEAIHLHGRRLLADYAPADPDQPFEARLEAFCRSRAALLERITPVRQSALLRCHESEVVRRGVELGQFLLRLDVIRVFGRELQLDEDPQARELRASALAMSASWSSWRSLRQEQGLSVQAASAVMAFAMSRILLP